KPATLAEFVDFWTALSRPATRVRWTGLGTRGRLIVTYQYYDPVGDDVTNPVFDYEYPNYRALYSPLHVVLEEGGSAVGAVPGDSCGWPAAMRSNDADVGAPFRPNVDSETEGSTTPTDRFPTLYVVASLQGQSPGSSLPLLRDDEVRTSMSHSHG